MPEICPIHLQVRFVLNPIKHPGITQACSTAYQGTGRCRLHIQACRYVCKDSSPMFCEGLLACACGKQITNTIIRISLLNIAAWISDGMLVHATQGRAFSRVARTKQKGAITLWTYVWVCVLAMSLLSLTSCIRYCDLIFTHSQGFTQLTRSSVIVQNSVIVSQLSSSSAYARSIPVTCIMQLTALCCSGWHWGCEQCWATHRGGNRDFVLRSVTMICQAFEVGFFGSSFRTIGHCDVLHFCICAAFECTSKLSCELYAQMVLCIYVHHLHHSLGYFSLQPHNGIRCTIWHGSQFPPDEQKGKRLLRPAVESSEANCGVCFA